MSLRKRINRWIDCNIVYRGLPIYVVRDYEKFLYNAEQWRKEGPQAMKERCYAMTTQEMFDDYLETLSFYLMLERSAKWRQFWNFLLIPLVVGVLTVHVRHGIDMYLYEYVDWFKVAGAALVIPVFVFLGISVPQSIRKTFQHFKDYRQRRVDVTATLQHLPECQTVSHKLRIENHCGAIPMLQETP